MSTHKNIMKEKRVTFSEIPKLKPVAMEIYNGEKRRNTIAVTERMPSNINAKLERYRNLLAKEYQLRFKMERAKSDLEARRKCCMHCQKQRDMNTSSPNQQFAAGYHERRIPKVYSSQEVKDLDNECKRKGRPLSADSLHIPLSAMLRKEEAKLKAEHRRASIQSLEEDFKKYQNVVSKVRALSLEDKKNNSSLDSVEEENLTPPAINHLKRGSISKQRPSSSIL